MRRTFRIGDVLVPRRLKKAEIDYSVLSEVVTLPKPPSIRYRCKALMFGMAFIATAKTHRIFMTYEERSKRAVLTNDDPVLSMLNPQVIAAMKMHVTVGSDGKSCSTKWKMYSAVDGRKARWYKIKT